MTHRLPSDNFSIVHEPDVVQGRDLGEVLEVLLLVGVAVVGAPGVPDGELVEAQHVHHAGKTKKYVQLRPFCS